MKRLGSILLIITCAFLTMGSDTGKPGWRMKADYVEACSCHLFCPCYFNKVAEHPYCEFNMAVNVREGHSGKTDLAGAKYWLTGDLGDEWGKGKGKWVVVSFDPKTNKEQRDALAPIILKTYGLEWSELKVQEAPIEIDRGTGDVVTAKLDGGKLATMKLKREGGADGKGVKLMNVNYFGATSNSGFELYKSIEHKADVQGHSFSHSDRNAFLITIDTNDKTKAPMSGMGSKTK